VSDDAEDDAEGDADDAAQDAPVDRESVDRESVDPEAADREAAGEPPDHLAGLRGMDLVMRTLEEARGAARTQGKDVGRGLGSPRRRPSTGRRVAGAGQRRSWSGPGPDGRDPQLLGSVTRDLARRRGWSTQVAQGMVFGQWETVVGEQIAEHATPTTLSEGVLTVSAESTAWATQLRMVQAQLLAKIAAAVGDGVVASLRIVGPVAPSWRKGPLHIAGRGPRDTYG
jgi:predicted nucleic acid-binding Zn ribbon protein